MDHGARSACILRLSARFLRQACSARPRVALDTGSRGMPAAPTPPCLAFSRCETLPNRLASSGCGQVLPANRDLAVVRATLRDASLMPPLPILPCVWRVMYAPCPRLSPPHRAGSAAPFSVIHPVSGPNLFSIPTRRRPVCGLQPSAIRAVRCDASRCLLIARLSIHSANTSSPVSVS